ncbi:MAG: PAS domain-containing protein [Deinococcales bacterium]
MTENMLDLICWHRSDGRLRYVSPSSMKLLGFSPEELVGQDPLHFVSREDR